MNTSQRIASRACASLLLAGLIAGLATGCGQKPSEPAATATATPSEPATSSSRDFGDHILYFNAIDPETFRQIADMGICHGPGRS